MQNLQKKYWLVIHKLEKERFNTNELDYGLEGKDHIHTQPYALTHHPHTPYPDHTQGCTHTHRLPPRYHPQAKKPRWHSCSCAHTHGCSKAMLLYLIEASLYILLYSIILEKSYIYVFLLQIKDVVSFGSQSKFSDHPRWESRVRVQEQQAILHSLALNIAKECSNYCMRAHISHGSKIMLQILQQYVNWEHLDVQAGFRKGRGTRDQTGRGVHQAVYCHPAYLFSFYAEDIMRNARLNEAQLESRLPREILITSDMQINHLYGRK